MRAQLAARTVNIKIKFADFTLITRSHTMSTPIDASPAVAAVAGALLDTVELKHGGPPVGGQPVRLRPSGGRDPAEPRSGLLRIGPGRRRRLRAGPASPEAADLLDRAHEEAERIQHSWGSVTAAVDAIRARYGGSSVGPASLVGADGLRIRRRGEAQWGPTGRRVDPQRVKNDATL